MRVSSSTLFNSNASVLGQLQTQLQQTQQQIASGRRAMDPVTAARALEVTQSDAMNTQYAANSSAAYDTLSLAEGNLQGVTSLLQDVRDAVVGAGSASLTDNDRKNIASSLSSSLQQLISLANSKDGAGNYLFAGFQSKTQPFVDTPAGVGYFGDDGQHNVQASATRQIASSDSGADVFMRVKNGNGAFVTQANPANTGSGVVSVGSVSSPASLTGNNYSVSFSVIGGVTTYDVTNTTTSAVVSAGNTYVSGQAISFDGLQFDIQGAPANGDAFTVSPSANESMFKTISDLIGALNTPVVGANLANSLKSGLNQVDNALNNVLSTRSSQASRLNEIDTLRSAGEDLGLQFKKTLSGLQDIDYAKAITDLTQQQMSLQAAQQSFAKIANLSLFNYL